MLSCEVVTSWLISAQYQFDCAAMTSFYQSSLTITCQFLCQNTWSVGSLDFTGIQYMGNFTALHCVLTEHNKYLTSYHTFITTNSNNFVTAFTFKLIRFLPHDGSSLKLPTLCQWNNTRISLHLTKAYSKTVQTYYMARAYTFCAGYFNFNLTIIDKKNGSYATLYVKCC